MLLSTKEEKLKEHLEKLKEHRKKCCEKLNSNFGIEIKKCEHVLGFLKKQIIENAIFRNTQLPEIMMELAEEMRRHKGIPLHAAWELLHLAHKEIKHAMTSYYESQDHRWPSETQERGWVGVEDHPVEQKFVIKEMPNPKDPSHQSGVLIIEEEEGDPKQLKEENKELWKIKKEKEESHASDNTQRFSQAGDVAVSPEENKTQNTYTVSPGNDDGTQDDFMMELEDSDSYPDDSVGVSESFPVSFSESMADY